MKYEGRPREAAGWGLKPRPQFLTQLLLNDHPELYISSGRRTRAENRRIRGASLTGHTSGREVDLNAAVSSLQDEEQLLTPAREQALRTPGTTAVQSYHGTGYHLHLKWPA